MEELVDSHCHITDPRFDADRHAVIRRAREAGVRRIVAVGGGGPIELSEAGAALAETDPDIVATAGIHPHDAKDYNDAIEARIVALLEAERVSAVGETGLDYYYEHSPRDRQREALERQLALARRYDVPIVLHCRDAYSELREILSGAEHRGVGGVVHCFTGTYEDACWYLDAGFYISFSGILTFPNAGDLRAVAARLPLDRLMVETDAPLLAPGPHRGKRNEPAFVVETARTLAQVQKAPLARVAEATARNAVAMFFSRS